MPSTVKKIDNHLVKLTMEVSAEQFEKGMQHAYMKNRGKINLSGFRQGKAPRKLIEMQFGKEIFFEDAINFVFPEVYRSAIEEHALEVVSEPMIDVDTADVTKVTITAEVTLKPEVSVTSYKGLTYKKPETAVKDEEIDEEMNGAREKNARIITVTDRAVQDGDVATIDFEGFVDGVAFDGGKGENYDLTIGAHQFIDTFEDQLIGKSIGDDVDVNVTFPTPYGNEELAGKPALFKVKIHGIKMKELPEVNDEFAQDVSEFETLAEYKEDISKKIAERKEKSAERDIENGVVESLVEQLVADIPDVMIETEVKHMVDDFGRRMQMQGLTMEQYFMYTGQDPEALKESYRANAEKNVKARLALEWVAKQENAEVTDEEVSAELDRMAEMYRMERARIEMMMGEGEKKGLMKDLQVQKALKTIIENAIAVEE